MLPAGRSSPCLVRTGLAWVRVSGHVVRVRRRRPARVHA